MAVVILEPKKILCHCIHCFPFCLPWSNGTRCHDLCFLNVEVKASFFTFLFHFHQEALWFLFTFCHKGGFVCISEITDTFSTLLIPACASSSPAFCMMYSAHKLHVQSDTIQPWHTPFPIWNQSMFHVWFCFFLTCIQVSQEADKVVWYSHLFKNFPVCCNPHHQRP